MKKVRLDILLSERGLAENRSKAQRLVMAGQVLVNGQVIFKPGTRFLPDVTLRVVHGPRFVSRGGEKLQAALQDFSLEDLKGWICADVGASTGGFTDCLLQHGAVKVFAIDVGFGVLHWKLRKDQRVISMERTNARYLEKLPEPVSLVTIDISFISLRMLFPVVNNWFGQSGGRIIVLVKPQFEAGRFEVAKGSGVVRDPSIHRQVLMKVLTFAEDLNFGIQGLVRSPLLGPKGNVEFLSYMDYPGESVALLETLIDKVLIY